jgi:hypothetical protein
LLTCWRSTSLDYPAWPVNDEEPRMIEEFVKQNHAQLWIQHDYTAGIKRKIAPAFYEGAESVNGHCRGGFGVTNVTATARSKPLVAGAGVDREKGLPPSRHRHARSARGERPDRYPLPA